MSAREEILNRLKGRQRSGSAPGPWRSQRQYDDLAGQFGQALTATKGEYYRSTSFEEALIRIDDIFKEIQVKRALVDDQPPLNGVDLAARWPEISWHIVGRSDEDLRSFAASADIGLSVGEAALAETGSVLVSSGPSRSRLTTLLPPVHLALVPGSCLTTDLFTWTAERQGPFPSSMTLISGPSKTADIEQTMATGVHGPGRFIVVLYADRDD
jgi:L-lactate utilization protein LutC